MSNRLSRRSSHLLLAVFPLAAILGIAGRAEANWGLRNSFGESIYLVEPKPTPHVANPDGSNSDKLVPGCDGALCYDGNRRMPMDFEVMPYYGFGLASLDLAMAFNIESRNDLGFKLHFRPGVRVYPLMGLYARGFLDLTTAQLTAAQSTTGAISATVEGQLGLGVGYQFRLGAWGAFAELSFNPRLWGAGSAFNMPMEIRLGWALEP